MLKMIRNGTMWPFRGKANVAVRFFSNHDSKGLLPVKKNKTKQNKSREREKKIK